VYGKSTKTARLPSLLLSDAQTFNGLPLLATSGHVYYFSPCKSYSCLISLEEKRGDQVKKRGELRLKNRRKEEEKIEGGKKLMFIF
jgi:hypothetical protein